MKKIFFLITLLIILSFNHLGDKEIIVNHKIDSVTVFLNNAEINRSSNVIIPKGKIDLLFKNVSSNVLKEGVNVFISNNVKVYSINIEKSNSDVKNNIKNNTNWKILQQKINILNDSIDLINLEKTILNEEELYYEENMKLQKTNVSFSNIDEGAKYFRKKIKSLHRSIIEQNKKLSKIKKEKEQLLLQQEKLLLKASKTNTTVRITVINNKEALCDIKFKYLVNNAIWKPYYSIRAKKGSNNITLEYQAQIYNDTGNDWNNKPLTLAMMDFSTDVSKPLMDTWVLNGYSSYADEGILSNTKGNYSKDNKMSYDVFHIDDLSTRFKIKNLHYIPSDATPHLIDVKTFIKQSDFYTLSIPKIKDGAYLIASIHDWESMGLLNGPINLYYNNVFQGISKLNTQQINKTLDISLGKDNSYTITRRKINTLKQEKFIGLNIKEVLTYEFIIQNKKNKSVVLELRDQLPISIDKNVEVISIETSNAVIDKQSGLLTWSVKLKPLSSEKIILKYSVKYPKSRRGLFRHNRNKLKSPRFF